MKAAVEGLTRTVLGSMDELYTDVKAFAGRELSVLVPKIQGLNEQFVNVESLSCRTSIEVNSLRRELNDRYDFMLVKLDSISSDLRELKEKQSQGNEEINQIRDEQRRLDEKFRDFYLNTGDKIKGLIENVAKNSESLNEVDKKAERNFANLQNEVKKNYDALVKRIKDYDETCQTQMNGLRMGIKENDKDIENLNQGMSTVKEKVNEVRSELSHKIEDFWENYEIQMKKLNSNNLALEGKVDNYWERFQEGLDEISKSISVRFETFSKSFVMENRVLAERIGKCEKDLDLSQRENRTLITGIERSLLIQEERIAYLSNNYR